MRFLLRNPLRKGVVRQAALAFTATMVPNAMFFVFHFVMSRQLGVERYGALASLISLLVLASIPATIVATVVAKLVAELQAVEGSAGLGAFGRRAVVLSVAAGGAAFAIAALASGPVAEYLQIRETAAIFLTGLALGISIVIPVLRGVLQGLQDYAQLAISTTLDGLGRVLFSGILVAQGFGVTGAVTGLVLAFLVSAIYTAIVVGRRLPADHAGAVFDARRLMQASLGVTISAVGLAALGYVDLPMVKHFFSPRDAGLYGAGSLCGKILFYALGFVPMLVLPKAAARLARGEASTNVLLGAFGLIALVVVPGLALFATSPALILRILTGTQFLDAAPILLPYGIAMAALGTTTMLAAYNIGSHRFVYLLPVSLAALGEIVGIQLFHQSLTQILMILVVANAFALSGTLLACARPRFMTTAMIAHGKL